MMSYIENERETFPQPTEPRACRHLELFGSSCTYYVRKTEQEFGTKPTTHLNILTKNEGGSDRHGPRQEFGTKPSAFSHHLTAAVGFPLLSFVLL